MTGGGKASVGAIIVAAGSGQRFGDPDKVLRPVAGKALILHSVEVFALHPRVAEIVVVAGSHTVNRVREAISALDCGAIQVCLGGETRSDSVRCGLRELSPGIALVAVHDAARPLVSMDLVSLTIEAAERHGAAVPVTSVTDTLYRVSEDGVVEAIENRERLRHAQTPQIARRDWLDAALLPQNADTDEGSALLRHGYVVATVDGSPKNMKVTWPSDVAIAEAVLKDRSR